MKDEKQGSPNTKPNMRTDKEDIISQPNILTVNPADYQKKERNFGNMQFENDGKRVNQVRKFSKFENKN